MAIKKVKSVADIPSEELHDWGPVELSISEQGSTRMTSADSRWAQS